ncbi:unnamed protein product [Litomosoides sigmodontis]|uniref:Uncharacterized protein n=1 Tax=Litomosoides sigmodontis TaxID=42156 RepID=A0A3P7JPF6_LITSI|nr:unnamed protein product [Litomosoides sigmodontis]
MGHDDHGPKIPSYTLYDNYREIPKLRAHEERLARIGLKDPWIRNYSFLFMGRFAGDRWGSFKYMIRAGWKLGCGVAAAVIAIEESYSYWKFGNRSGNFFTQLRLRSFFCINNKLLCYKAHILDVVLVHSSKQHSANFHEYNDFSRFSATSIINLLNGIAQILSRNQSNFASSSQDIRQSRMKLSNPTNVYSQKRHQPSTRLDTGGSNFDRFIVSERRNDNPMLDWIIGKFSRRG